MKQLKTVELITCRKCECIYAKKSASKHRNLCETLLATNFSSISTNSFHGFVKNAVFYGKFEEVKPPAELCRLECCWIKENLIFLHPSLMQICRLNLGDPVCVNDFGPFCVWPNSNVQLGCVGGWKNFLLFRSLSKNSENILRIERIPSIFQLENVELCCVSNKSFENTEEFRGFVCYYLRNSYLHENSNIFVRYFGQICEFSCRSFMSTLSCNVLNSDLLSDLTNLSLTDDEFRTNETFSTNTDLDNSVISVASSDENCANFVRLPDKPNFNRVFRVSDKTELKFVDLENSKIPSVCFRKTVNDLGGLTAAKTVLHDHVISPVKLFNRNDREEILKNFKIRTILLYGPSGCGKTSLCRALAATVETEYANFIDFDTEISSEKFVFSKSGKPQILFLDDFDTYFNVKDSTTSSDHSFSKQNSSKISRLIDRIESARNSLIFFLAATNRPEKLTNSIRRRFDVEIEISVPNSAERLEICQKILADYSHRVSDSDLERISSSAHGFTPSDLVILCKEAGVYSTKRGIQGGKNEIFTEDLISALTKVRPSGMREIFLEIPKVRWSDIGGQERLKTELRQAVDWPLKHAAAFRRLGIKPPSGVLMYGPPGCSKTMIAKALATESGLNFLAIKGPELFSKWVGESERAVRDVFRKARQVAPSVVFFDEIDALANDRGSSASSGGSNVGDRVLTQLLTELDGVQALTNVVVVAATNRPDLMDRALLRPGRFDRMVYVPLPDAQTRRDILSIQFRKIPVAGDVDMEILIRGTDGFSGAELVMLCTEAAMLAMQHSLEADVVRWAHFEQCLHVVKPRTDERLLKIYEDFSLCKLR